MFDISHEGRTTLAVTAEDARALGYPETAIASAMRENAKARMLREVDGYRQRLSGAEAGVDRPGPERIGIWLAKARLARAHLGDADAMPEPFKAHLTREAAAKGRTLADQLQRIVFKADTFEALGLLVDAMEAEAEAGLSTVSDEDGLAGGFDAYLVAAQQQADAAFADGLASLNS